MSLRVVCRLIRCRIPSLLIHPRHRTFQSSASFPNKSPVAVTPSPSPVRVATSDVPSEEPPPPLPHQQTIPVPAVLEIKIQRSTSVEELLQMSTTPTIMLKHSCFILLRLGQLSKTDAGISFEGLIKDARFERMCNLIQRGDYSHGPHLLLAAIQGLEGLRVPESTDLYETLNIEVKWAMRRCQVRYLARAVALFGTQQVSKKSGQTTDITELAVHTLQRRWVEVASGSDFIAVFKVMHYLDEDTRKKLEDRAVEMASVFTPSEIRQIFITLAAQKRRPTPLLRTLSFHFTKASDVSSAKDLIELTYALNELTFADAVLMEKVFTNLCPEIPSIDNPALTSSLVTSLGQMRFKHKGLLHLLDEWVIQHMEKFRPFDFAAWLLMSAVLNQQSSSLNEFSIKARTVLTPKTSSSPADWINIVHSFLTLNKHTDEMMAAALSPEIVKGVENLGPKVTKSKIRLLNINAVAKRRTKSGYKGPLLNPKVESLWASTVLNTADQKLSVLALETISSLLTPEKYLRLGQKLTCGVFADAICYLNKNMQPIPITEAMKNRDARGVAIVTEGYTSLTLGLKEATGQTLLNRRLLEEEGYFVLPLPYTEFNATEKLISRAKYVEQRLKLIGNQPITKV